MDFIDIVITTFLESDISLSNAPYKSCERVLYGDGDDDDDVVVVDAYRMEI